MNLDQLNIAIRPRRDWEAVDLGLLMARRWWWQLQKVWLLLTLPWLLASWLVPGHLLYWFILSLWWLKPLLERPLLLILSQGVFGVQLHTREVLRAFWRLALIQPVASLTWRRLSPYRSMDLPVIQLEGLRGTERRHRLTVLHRHDSGPAIWLTLLGHSLEQLIGFSWAILLIFFIPPEVDFDWSLSFWTESRQGPVLIVLFAYISMALLAPLYVACGFSLYLNRRVKLEGWDLEIAFKRMAQKRGLLVLTLVALLGGLTLVDQPAHATTEREAISEQMRRIKEGPDFHTLETREVLKPVAAKDDGSPGWLVRILAMLVVWLAGMGSDTEGLAGLADIAELLLWAAILAALFLLVFKYGHWFKGFHGVSRHRGHRYQPQTLFGMEVTPESLPEDISQASLALWQTGEQRAALALLYRASLVRLLEWGVPLQDGSTEQECLRLAESCARDLRLPPQAVGYFTRLTAVWRQLAYGHRAPEDETGRDLCAEWRPSWEPGHE